MGWVLIIPLIGIMLGLVSWYPGLWLHSRVGGWYALARSYRFSGAHPPHCHRSVSGSVGGMQMRNALEVAVLPQGLYLRVMPFFGAGHPPVCIPWDAVTHVYRKETPTWNAMRLMVAVPEREKPIQMTLPGACLDDATSYLPPAQDGPVGPQYSWPVIALTVGKFVFVVVVAFVLTVWFTIL